MDGSNHGYLPNHSYGDVFNDNPAVWNGGNSNQFAAYEQQNQAAPTFSHTQAPQELYSEYIHQPSYGRSDTPHAQYQESRAYSNSPYSSHFQQSISSRDAHGSDSYGRDPSLQNSAVPAHQHVFSSFPPQEPATISPHSLQYNERIMQVNQAVNPASTASGMFPQPSNGYQRPQDTSSYINNQQSGNVNNNLSSANYAVISKAPSEHLKQPTRSPSSSGSIMNGSSSYPAHASPAVNPLRITHQAELSATNQTVRAPLEHAPFLRWSDTPMQVAPGLKSKLKQCRSEMFLFHCCLFHVTYATWPEADI